MSKWLIFNAEGYAWHILMRAGKTKPACPGFDKTLIKQTPYA